MRCRAGLTTALLLALATASAATDLRVDRTRIHSDETVQIVVRLTDAGLYALYRPAAMGGLQVDPISAFLAIEHLARADGSVAWCAHVSSGNSYQLATGWPKPSSCFGRRCSRWAIWAPWTTKVTGVDSTRRPPIMISFRRSSSATPKAPLPRWPLAHYSRLTRMAV